MIEQFDHAFLELLDGLNQAVLTTGEPVEGNLFYEHHSPSFSRSAITQRFSGKRSNLLCAVHGRSRILEIGVNAGHSALMMLYHNPNLRYVGVDICRHRYTYAAMDFLKKTFPGRVEFFVGDSVFVLPEINIARPDMRFDIAHIDGLHTLNHCKTDTFNAMSLVTAYGWIVIDDTDLQPIREFHAQLIADKILLDKSPDGWKHNGYHATGLRPY